MAKISKNFDTCEFMCSCCKEVKYDVSFVESLQQLRDLIDMPLLISSSYRCKKHNERVGGAGNSYHLYGRAADIWTPELSLYDLFSEAQKIKRFLMGGIGIYPEKGFIHVDDRRHSARWGYLGVDYTGIQTAIDFMRENGGINSY